MLRRRKNAYERRMTCQDDVPEPRDVLIGVAEDAAGSEPSETAARLMLVPPANGSTRMRRGCRCNQRRMMGTSQLLPSG